ncbi:MAG: RagB/SusD family nutrient uptake outer membrane protein [Odoribacteraceae bacterium]|jgi:hypothetical protein|nr:RagB/SusD family nutrient uptake outer membrane protein [Odoribacteraceae bacterium]
MKKNTTTIIALLLAQTIATSCSDWLEVDTSTNVKQEVLFSDPAGYRTALNGVYRLLSGVELYGRNLTWGVASVLGNNYDANRLPGPYSTTSNNTSYREMAAGDYTSKPTTDLVDPIWEQAYRVIANCNNIIAYIEKEDPAIFPVAANDTEKNMILGEAIGIRAMMHLDILRLFAPSTKADDGKTYIPYVAVFPERQPVHLTVTATLERVIADLERARELLAIPDTVYNANDMTSYTRRLQPSSGLSTTTFFATRGTRFNYFAASAMLARAYQWRGAEGDAERAYRTARDVYRFSTDKTWFSFTPAGNLSTVENSIYRKMPHDILFAIYNNNMYAMVTAATINTTSQSFFLKNDDRLFIDDADDFRINLINTDKTSRRWSMPTGNQSASPTADIIKYQGPLAPVVRLSEMIYIMCEYLVDVDRQQAVALLEKVRTARGAKRLLGNPSREEFLQELYLDMTREFMSEGQTFALYKRLNAPMYNGAGVINMTGRYVLPVPYSEEAYIHL